MSGITRDTAIIPNYPNHPDPDFYEESFQPDQEIALNFARMIEPLFYESDEGIVLNSARMIEPLFYEMVPMLGLEELQSLILTNTIFHDWLQPIYIQKIEEAAAITAAATKVCQNWQTILQEGLLEVEYVYSPLVENAEEIEYLNNEEFIDALVGYLIKTSQPLDSLTSDLLEIPNLAEELDLSEEMKELFQNHLELLRDKKKLDLHVFRQVVASEIIGIEEANNLNEFDLTQLLEERQGGIESLILGSGLDLCFLSEDIGKLINLRELRIEFNQFTELPKEIGKLINLQKLTINSNDQLTEFPKEIGKLINLQRLTINHNDQLTKLPKEIGKLINLNFLDLMENALIELPKEIGELINLETLYLEKNQLTELPKEIGGLMKLTTLSFSGNQITKLPNGIKSLIYLEVLILYNNPLSLDALQEIQDLKVILDQCWIR